MHVVSIKDWVFKIKYNNIVIAFMLYLYSLKKFYIALVIIFVLLLIYAYLLLLHQKTYKLF